MCCKDGERIGEGSNHVLANNDSTVHAEVIAIRDDYIYEFINKLSLNEQNNTILDLKSLNRDERIEEFIKNII